jgi:hypothetical protein
VTTAVLGSVWVSVYRDRDFVTEFGCALVPFLVGGYFFGLIVWKLNERQYHRAIKDGEQH